MKIFNKYVAAKFGRWLASDLTIFYPSFEAFYTSKYFPTFRMETAVFSETLPSINNIQAALIEWLALSRLAMTSHPIFIHSTM
jgi:hypothetical protein